MRSTVDHSGTGMALTALDIYCQVVNKQQACLQQAAVVHALQCCMVADLDLQVQIRAEGHLALEH